MPTKKHRYTITSDEKVEFALRRSRRSFPPGTSDSKILAALVSKGEEALKQGSQAEEDYEQRRRAAAKRLADRFRRPEPRCERPQQRPALAAALERRAFLKDQHDARKRQVEFFGSDHPGTCRRVVQIYLAAAEALQDYEMVEVPEQDRGAPDLAQLRRFFLVALDRKSTRLNSSH